MTQGLNLPEIDTAMKPAPAGVLSQSIEPPADAGKPDAEAKATGKPASKADVVKRAKERWDYIESTDGSNRANQLSDFKFVWEPGSQWNADVKKKRDDQRRPTLEFNQVRQFVKNIVNDQRESQPAIRVRPQGNGATEKVAEIYSGLAREIEYRSRAQSIYDTALEHAVTGGRGYIRVVTEYTADDSFLQQIKIAPVSNALSVRLDPDALEPDKSDIQYGFVAEWLDKETFEAEWPTATALSWDDKAETYGGWLEQGKVCVCDYYEIVSSSEQLVQLSNGRTMWKSDYAKEAMKMATQAAGAPLGSMVPGAMPPQIVKEETRTRKRVDWYKLSAQDEPLAQYAWAGKYIPIVCIPGDEINIDGKRIYTGVVRNIRDPQMMYNYWFTMATEKIALLARAPWLGLSGKFEGHPEWEDANLENHPYLEYEPVKLPDGTYDTAAPERNDPQGPDAGLLAMLQLCVQNLRECSGMKDPTIGNTQPDQPWRSVLAQMRKGDIQTFHYGDNLARGITHLGCIVSDLVPHVYDTDRELRMLGQDGKEKVVRVNQQGVDANMQPSILNDLKRGSYDVVVDVGPAYATQRMAAANEIKEFMEAMGEQTAGYVGDLFAKSVDWPDGLGDEIAKRLKAMLPPQILAIADSDDDPQTAALKSQLQQAQQAAQQQKAQDQQAIVKLSQELDALKTQLHTTQGALADQENRTTSAQAGAATIQARSAAKDATAAADVQVQQMESADTQQRMALDRDKAALDAKMAQAEIGLKVFEAILAMVAKLGAGGLAAVPGADQQIPAAVGAIEGTA